MVFPEGQRGFVKTWRQRYQLQSFGLVEKKVEVVKDAIRELVRQGRAERRTWFT
jgi:hypothetical protein